MKFKKIIAALTAVTMALSLAACGKSDTVVVDLGGGNTFTVVSDETGIAFDLGDPLAEARELLERDAPVDIADDEVLSATSYFAEIAAESQRLGYSIPRVAGIDGDIAFWQFDRVGAYPHGSMRKFGLFNTSTNSTTIITVADAFYWNGNVYGLSSYGLGRIQCYDLQGNLVKETANSYRKFFILSDGSIVGTIDNKHHLISKDFSTITELTISTADAHGREIETMDYTLIGIHDNKLYANQDGAIYTINLTSLKSEKTELTENLEMANFTIGKYFFYHSVGKARVINIETGATVAYAQFAGGHFIGDSFYFATKEKIYKLIPPDGANIGTLGTALFGQADKYGELIFEFPLKVDWAVPLSDNRAVFCDSLGTFFYDISTGSIIAEINT